MKEQGKVTEAIEQYLLAGGRINGLRRAIVDGILSIYDDTEDAPCHEIDELFRPYR